MQTVKAIPPRSHTRSSYLPPTLSSASHVLVRHDAVRTSLQQPYDGPYKVIKRSYKYYTLRINNKDINISIDRLKPAFIDKELQIPDDSPIQSPPTQSPSPSSSSSSSSSPSMVPTGKTTRSGRRVHWPKHRRFQGWALRGNARPEDMDRKRKSS